MMYTREAVRTSVAASCLLVIEAVNRAGVHYATYIVEPNTIQYYDPRGTRHNPHYQILPSQLSFLRDQLKAQKFVHAVSEESANRYHRTGQPYYYIAGSGNDHWLHDLTVINTLKLSDSMLKVVDKINAPALALKMFVEGYDIGGKGDKRGNLRYDAGYCAMDQTDRGVVSGMNFPRRTKAASRMDGVGGRPTLEHSLFEAGCAVMELADMIQDSHPYPGMGMAEAIFQEGERNVHFGERWARDLGRDDLLEYARFDATSCFGTGTTSDHRAIKTERHVDSQNASERGEDHCPTVTILVPVSYHGCETLVRIGVNVYKKSCCSEATRRLQKNEDLARRLMDVENGFDDDSNDGLMPLHEKFIRPYGLTSDRWTYDADMDKDGMLSLYMNEIKALTDAVGRDRGLMIDVLHTIPLTPAADGWLDTFRAVAVDVAENRGVMGDNFFFRYVEVAMDSHGTVSHGRHRRCQTSHRGRITRRQAVQSWINMEECFVLANTSSDTKKVIKRLSASVKRGGVHGVGPFYAHVLLNLAIKLGLVTNHDHLENVGIAPTTRTFKRLKEMGFKSKAHVAEIVPFLKHRLKYKALRCENMVCEYLRKICRKGEHTQDVFVDDHFLYRANEDGVYVVDHYGDKFPIEYDEAMFNNGYEPDLAWWDEELSIGKGRHEWDDEVIRLNVSRRRRGNLV